MPQSLSKIYVHLVFSTKNRKTYLKDAAQNKELYGYMATILRDNVDSPAILINGVEDHIHALILQSRKFALMDIVKETKTTTSKWLKRNVVAEFAWQAGYGAFSVSESNLSQVSDYIRNQETHHQRMSFQDEFRELCRRHNLEIDERYVWD